MLYNPQTNQLWTRHQAFGKVLSLLPLGFIFSWIFFIPYISEIFGLIYNRIAKNRTKISLLFGLPACNLPNVENNLNQDSSSSSNFSLTIELKNYANNLLNIIRKP